LRGTGYLHGKPRRRWGAAGRAQHDQEIGL